MTEEIRNAASLAESTVKAVATGEVQPYRKRKPRKSTPVVQIETVTIDPLVMREALRLAGGDASRLTLNRDGSVTVGNRSRRKPVQSEQG